MLFLVHRDRDRNSTSVSASGSKTNQKRGYNCGSLRSEGKKSASKIGPGRGLDMGGGERCTLFPLDVYICRSLSTLSRCCVVCSLFPLATGTIWQGGGARPYRRVVRVRTLRRVVSALDRARCVRSFRKQSHVLTRAHHVHSAISATFPQRPL